MKFYELIPAYGRDYKNKTDVVSDFFADKDFEGDYQLGFKYINRPQFAEAGLTPCTIHLRYKRNTQIATVVLK